MEQIQALWTQYGQAHPILSHLFVALAVSFALPRFVAWAESTGIQKFTDWADAHQEKLLQRAGLSPEQIRSVKEHEIKDLRRTADELEANLKGGIDNNAPPAP